MAEKNAGLGRGPAFNDEIAALQRTHIRRNSGNERGSRKSRGGTRAVSGKRGSEQSREGGKDRTRFWSQIGVEGAKRPKGRRNPGDPTFG